MGSRLTQWNQGLQIIALLAAGGWAVWTFSVSILPRWGPAFVGELEITTEWLDSRSTCLIEIRFELENKSVLSQSIETVEYFAKWEQLPVAPEEGQFSIMESVLNPEEMTNLSNDRPMDSWLEGKFSPGGVSIDAFHILSSPVPGEVLHVVAYAHNTKVVVAEAASWEESCEGNAAPAKTNEGDGI